MPELTGFRFSTTRILSTSVAISNKLQILLLQALNYHDHDFDHDTGFRSNVNFFKLEIVLNSTETAEVVGIKNFMLYRSSLIFNVVNGLLRLQKLPPSAVA